MLALKPFQLHDLAAAALKDGLILAWEQGLGKTLASLLWPQLRQAKRVLIVAPAALHDQLAREAATRFRIGLVRVPTIAAARALGLHKPLPATAPSKPRYFLTSWEELTRNGAYEHPPDAYAGLNDATTPPPGHWASGLGQTVRGIHCTYRPSLATQLACWGAHGAGIDCLVADEGTRLQADDSLMSTALRRLVPTHRLILTGTPIKNRLDSIFWLAWWAAGGSPTPTALWPYPGTNEGRALFADQHLQTDRFHTREREAQANHPEKVFRKIEKRSNRACNIEHLYKLLAPLVLRRRKTQCGTSMQPCTYHPVNVPPGTHQYTAYDQLLRLRTLRGANGQIIKHPRAVTARRLEMLKECCLAPWSSHLPHRSPHVYTPKTQAVLSLVEQCLSRGEQVLIGSPYLAFTEALMNLLKEGGVRAVRCDGTEPPASRALLAGSFKRQHHSVMVAGLKAMAEGHDFAQCPNLILPALSWAMDEVEQFIHRVWRLSSTKPVKVYLISIDHTLDARLSQAHGEKKDTAGLALDGEITAEVRDPISLDQLLAETLQLHQNLPSGPLTENEVHLNTTARPQLAHLLRTAQQRYDEWHPPVVPTNPPTTELDGAAAVASIAYSPPINPLDFIRREAARHRKRKPDQP